MLISFLKYFLLRPLIQLLKFQDKFFTAITIHSMRLLGRSRYPIHPKHLYDSQRNSSLKKLLLEKTPGNFLDLGSGVGSDVITAAKIGWFADGLEYDENNILQTKSTIKQYKEKIISEKINIYNHNLEETPYPLLKDKYDLINYTNVLEQI